MLSLLTSSLGAPFPGCKGGTLEGCPGTQNCSVHWIDTYIDKPSGESQPAQSGH